MSSATITKYDEITCYPIPAGQGLRCRYGSIWQCSRRVRSRMTSSSRTVGTVRWSFNLPSSSGRRRQFRMAFTRGGCCTWLLYGVASDRRDTVRRRLTPSADAGWRGSDCPVQPIGADGLAVEGHSQGFMVALANRRAAGAPFTVIWKGERMPGTEYGPRPDLAGAVIGAA